MTGNVEWRLYKATEELIKQYRATIWQLHDKVKNHKYESEWDQCADFVRLGKLGRSLQGELIRFNGMVPIEKDFYFTFGHGQTPGIGYYTVIKATHEELARKRMNDRYGDKWAFCYKSAEEAGVDRFDLTRV